MSWRAPFVLILALGGALWFAPQGPGGFDLPVPPPPLPGTQGSPPQGGVSPIETRSRAGELPPREHPKPEPVEDPSDVPPPVFFGEELEGRTIAFVIDQSGSMATQVDPFVDEQGRTVAHGNRFQLAVAEVNKTLLGLDPTHAYEVELFVCGAQFAHERKLLPATRAQVAQDVRWLGLQFPWGGTGTGPAVVWALALEPDVVVLVTDGAPGCTSFGVDFDYHERLILSFNKRPIPIHVWGIGLTSSTRRFCQSIASKSGGMFREVQ